MSIEMPSITAPVDAKKKQEKKHSFDREQRNQDVETILSGVREKAREEDFINETKNGYTSKEVEADLETVRRRKELFEQKQAQCPEEIIQKIREGKKFSEALEVVVSSYGEKMEWFGKNAKLALTTDFDDIVNGVDGVLEFAVEGEGPQRLALVVDASMRPDFSTVEKKILRGISKVERGLAHVKYFKSQIDDFEGKLTTVLPVVIGVQGENAEKLFALIAEYQKLEEKEGFGKEKSKLIAKIKNHPSHVIFLREIQIQLEMYANIFKRKNSFLQYEIQKITSIIANLLEEKKEIDFSEMENDGVFRMIQVISKRESNLDRTKKVGISP